MIRECLLYFESFTNHILGILLFLVEIAILCWVKFYTVDHMVAWVATGILIPIFVIFIAFAAHFYLKLVAHKSEVSSMFIFIKVKYI